MDTVCPSVAAVTVMVAIKIVGVFVLAWHVLIAYHSIKVIDGKNCEEPKEELFSQSAVSSIQRNCNAPSF